MAQAEQEYGDFENFFPKYAEAAEAQVKNREYSLSADGKARPRFLRARGTGIWVTTQYPDNQKMVAEAGTKKTVAGAGSDCEREFRVGRFYF